jgi:hypothetical protein
MRVGTTHPNAPLRPKPTRVYERATFNPSKSMKVEQCRVCEGCRVFGIVLSSSYRWYVGEASFGKSVVVKCATLVAPREG